VPLATAGLKRAQGFTGVAEWQSGVDDGVEQTRFLETGKLESDDSLWTQTSQIFAYGIL
jgi:hypothetical protein